MKRLSSFHILIILLLFNGNLHSSINEYIFPNHANTFSSYGTTGIIQMPSARIGNAGTIGMNFSQFDPYTRLSITANPFDWLEASYQYTDVSNRLYSTVFAFSGNQTYKDKGFDAKIRLIQETNSFPQISVGLRDMAGTGIFSSEYLVASKNIRNFDVSVGVGWGALSGSNFENPLIKLSERFKTRSIGGFGQGGKFKTDSFFRGDEVGIFGGITYRNKFLKNLIFKAEYDSTNYDLEGFEKIAHKSRFNFGGSYLLSKNVMLNLGFIRGNEIQAGFTMSFDFSDRNRASIINDKYKKPEEGIRLEALRNVTARNDRYFYLSTLRYLNEDELYLRSANINQDKYEVTFSQAKYMHYPTAYGRVFRLLDDIAPEEIKEFSLLPMNSRYTMAEISIDREAFKQGLKFGYLPDQNRIQIKQSNTDSPNHNFLPKQNFPRAFTSLFPDVQSHIGGPDRFFVGGLNLRLNSEILFNQSTNLQLGLRSNIIDSFDVLYQPSDSILPHVRTDIIRYLRDSNTVNIPRFQFNHFSRLSRDIYTRFSAGIFEEMFGGYGFEVLYRPFYSLWALGFEAYDVKQRAYKQNFDFIDYETVTGHATFYLTEPKSGILFKFIGGKYLAKDSGITIDASRRFNSGLRIGAYFSLTDISEEEFGEGSFDKGFYFDIPIESLVGYPSRRYTQFGLRPLTRDGAVKLITGFDLFGVTDQGSFYSIFRDVDKLYD